MNAFEKFLKILDGKMVEPLAYGWFHLMCWGIVILLTAFLCTLALKNKKEGKSNDNFIRGVVLTYAILGIILEVYKQLNFSFNSTTGEWHYQWYAFPFQFCSTPMYVALIAGCLKKCEFQKYLYAYLGTFALFAGLCVMFYPGDVFTRTIGINIQTMVCHGGMVVMGIFLLISGGVDLKWKSILKAMAVFSGLVVIALIMNVIFNSTGNTATFNMFYISPYLPCTLPILNLIYEKVPYVVFLLIYFIGFSLAGCLVFSVAMAIKSFCRSWHEKKNSFDDKHVMDIIFKNLKDLD